MYGQSPMSAMPDEELIFRLQQNPKNPVLFTELYVRWNDILRDKSNPLKSLSIDDQEDVLSEFWLKKMWIDQTITKFEDRDRGSFRSWLLIVFNHYCCDYQRKLINSLQKLSAISLNEELTSEGCSVLEFKEIETIQIELLLEIGRAILNQKQLELLKRRLYKEPLPPDWKRSWIDTNWHRIKHKMIAECQARGIGKF